jgi:hypothetical protein
MTIFPSFSAYGLLIGAHFVLGAEALVFGFSFFGFLTSLPPRFFSFDIAELLGSHRLDRTREAPTKRAVGVIVHPPATPASWIRARFVRPRVN